MPWHARKPDPWYAIRIRKGRRGIVYRVDGYDEAFALAVQARAEFVAQVEGYVGVAPIPKKFRPPG